MYPISSAVSALSASAAAIRALLEPVSPEQATWAPDSATWSLIQVMDHFYNEERRDFRAHLGELLAEPVLPWGALEPPHEPVTTLPEGLAGFLRERAASLDWLRGLESPDWERSASFEWGTLRAGDVLISWVEHDYLHLRQINELLHAWNALQGVPYDVRYGGGW